MNTRAQILELRLAGNTHAQIAQHVGLSPSRVGQILRSSRSREQIDELKARVHARAIELRDAGVWPRQDPKTTHSLKD